MTAHRNASIVRLFFEALSAGDVEASTRLLSPDIVWHLPCGGTVLGDKRDLRGMEELVQSTVANITASEGSFQFRVQDVYAGNEYAVAISRNTAQSRGKVLDILMAISFRIIDDTIMEVWEAPDDIDAFVRFWRDG